MSPRPPPLKPPRPANTVVQWSSSGKSLVCRVPHFHSLTHLQCCCRSRRLLHHPQVVGRQDPPPEAAGQGLLNRPREPSCATGKVARHGTVTSVIKYHGFFCILPYSMASMPSQFHHCVCVQTLSLTVTAFYSSHGHVRLLMPASAQLHRGLVVLA